MSWSHNAVYYELYPRAFADGDGDGHGDLEGLRLVGATMPCQSSGSLGRQVPQTATWVDEH